MGDALVIPDPRPMQRLEKDPAVAPCISHMWSIEKARQSGRGRVCSYVLRAGKLQLLSRTQGSMAVVAETTHLAYLTDLQVRIQKLTHLHQLGSAVRAAEMVGVQSSSLRGLGLNTSDNTDNNPA